MAWNEPGGNSNNQDPWGGKRRNNGDRKGPPDLDEAFRKLQESLNGLFGGGKNGVVMKVVAPARAAATACWAWVLSCWRLYGCTAPYTSWTSRSKPWCCASASTTRLSVLA